MGFLERRLTPVGPEQVAGVLALCGQDPVMGLPLAQQVMRWRQWGRGDVVALGRLGAPRAAAWTAGSLIPVGLGARPRQPALSRAELRSLAEHACLRIARHGSVLGPQTDVQAVWEHLEDCGTRARRECWNQPMLLAPGPQEVQDLLEGLLRQRPGLRLFAQALRPARPAEEALVLPASVDMFRHEVGYDPLVDGGAYARHVGELVRTGRTYVVLDDGAGSPVPAGARGAVVAFKADIGCLWPHSPGRGAAGIGQVTGVWTRPDLRGRGVAAVSLARVVQRVRAEHLGGTGRVSLYANSFNAPALALYARLGFIRHGTFATVLL